MRGMSTPKKAPVNGKLAAASPLRSPKSAGGSIRCVCENNVDRGLMVQCEVSILTVLEGLSGKNVLECVVLGSHRVNSVAECFRIK